MLRIFKWFAKWFCCHKIELSNVVSWHWIKWPDEPGDPAVIEVLYRCSRCGEFYYYYLFGQDECMPFAIEHAKKQKPDHLRYRFKSSH